MTSNNSEFTIDEPTGDFIEKEQAKFMGILQQAFDKGLVTETFYTYATSQICITDDWKEATEHYSGLYAELIEQGTNYDYYRLLERIEKGEAYLAKAERGSDDYAKGVRLYEQLCKQLSHYTPHKPLDGQRAG